MPGMILKEDIEKVRATADLYDIVSATVTLKPSGTGTYVGCARFMTRKRQAFPCVRRSVCGIASAAVLAETCSAMWSIRRTFDFRDAVELLADKYHIELRYDQSNAKKEHTGSKRARLLEANEAAQEFFRLAADDQRRARRAQTA